MPHFHNESCCKKKAIPALDKGEDYACYLSCSIRTTNFYLFSFHFPCQSLLHLSKMFSGDVNCILHGWIPLRNDKPFQSQIRCLFSFKLQKGNLIWRKLGVAALARAPCVDVNWHMDLNEVEQQPCCQSLRSSFHFAPGLADELIKIKSQLIPVWKVI